MPSYERGMWHVERRSDDFNAPETAVDVCCDGTCSTKEREDKLRRAVA